MSSLMLINPRKRGGAKKHRTAAQKAATRRLVAANKARRHTKSRSRTVVVHATANPSPRKRRRNPIKHVMHAVKHRARRRRNPIGGGGIKSLLMPAVVGTAGALVVKAAIGYLPLPATLKTGNAATLTKAALAILLGTFGAKFIGHKARTMAEGSLTVTATEAISALLASKGVQLGEVSDESLIAYYAPGMTYNVPALAQQSSMGEYQSGVGEYMSEYQYR